MPPVRSPSLLLALPLPPVATPPSGPESGPSRDNLVLTSGLSLPNLDSSYLSRPQRPSGLGGCRGSRGSLLPEALTPSPRGGTQGPGVLPEAGYRLRHPPRKAHRFHSKGSMDRSGRPRAPSSAIRSCLWEFLLLDTRSSPRPPTPHMARGSKPRPLPEDARVRAWARFPGPPWRSRNSLPPKLGLFSAVAFRDSLGL